MKRVLISVDVEDIHGKTERQIMDIEFTDAVNSNVRFCIFVSMSYISDI